MKSLHNFTKTRVLGKDTKITAELFLMVVLVLVGSKILSLNRFMVLNKLSNHQSLFPNNLKVSKSLAIRPIKQHKDNLLLFWNSNKRSTIIQTIIKWQKQGNLSI